MKKVSVSAVILLIIVAAVSCQSHRKNSASKATIASVDTVSLKDTFSIQETRWILVSLNGESAADRENEQSQAYIMLDKNSNDLYGSGGCNSIFGKYELKEKNLVSFTGIGMTKKFCTDVILNENKMVNALKMTTFYTINGHTLTLFRAMKAPLAEFEASTSGPEE